MRVILRVVPISIVFLSILLVLPVMADSLFVRCAGDSVRISISAYDQVGNAAGQELVVLVKESGSCEDYRELEHPYLPYPDSCSVEYQFTLAEISPDRFKNYILRRKDTEGNLHQMDSLGDVQTWDRDACHPDAVSNRGKLTDFPWSGPIKVEGCEAACWPMEELNFERADPGWEDYVNTDQIVDILGEMFVDGMPGGTGFFVYRVVPVEGPHGCNTVASERVNWGSLKSVYR